jgi:hypothetical protein
MGRFVIFLLLVGLISVGCSSGRRAQSSSPDSVASASPAPCPFPETEAMEPSGTGRGQVGSGGRVDAPTAGFSLALPPGWLWVVPESSDAEALSTRVVEADPERGPVVAGLLSALPCTHTYLFDLVSVAPARADRPLAETCTVGMRRTEGESIEELLNLNANAVRQRRRGEATVTFPVELPAGSAGRLDTVQQFEGVDLGDDVHHGSMYFWVEDDREYTLSCLDVEPHPDHWLAIAETFEFLPVEE